MGRSRLAVVMPAFNEQDTIADVVRAAVAYADVIVVNDCSTDDTVARAEKAGATVISNAKNQGYDRTLHHGMAEAHRLGYEAAVTLDADGEHNPEVLSEFKKLLIDDHVPLVIGRRPHPARFGEHVFVWIMHKWLGVDDILCGCKGYHLALFEENGGFDHVGSIGTELAAASILRGHAFRQVDVVGRTRADQPRFGNCLKANLRLFMGGCRVARYLKTVQKKRDC